MKSSIKIGNAQAFWGDSSLAARQLLHQQLDLDFLTLDYLSEVSLSILAIQKEKDPASGYAKDFVQVIADLAPLLAQGSKCRLIANAGGLNPLGCAQACAEKLKQIAPGLNLKIAVVTGDAVLHLIQADPADNQFCHLETGERATKIIDKMVTANAYLGARPIAEALTAGASLVITGRVADPSLTVGPCMAHFGWSDNAYDTIAGATVAGHLIECGTQVTGGMSTDWLKLEDPFHIPFPVAEVSSDGTCVITKPKLSGGAVTLKTVKEQLLYEIGDPENYLSPDATVSFSHLQLEEVGLNRIKVSGARGRPHPPSYKVSATYRDGFKVEGMLAIYGPQAVEKGRLCGEILLKKMQEAGIPPARSNIECIGGGDIVPIHSETLFKPKECMLRLCLADPEEKTLEFFSKELASLVTSGPQGVTGYSSGRPKVRALFSYWPCLVARQSVKPHVQMIEVS